jgi:6-pyruvoyltetrahydropterin/6-carboxytetrahydropterin synthase
MAKYLSTKTYGNDRGLSCCFRQWRSTHSHCSLLHGYSIGIKLIFESETLDDRNWVMDFGGLKAFKEWSEWQFDHTTIIATDDPHLEKFLKLAELGLNDVGGILDLRLVPGVGCEKFSELAFFKMKEILENEYYKKSEEDYLELLAHNEFTKIIKEQLFALIKVSTRGGLEPVYGEYFRALPDYFYYFGDEEEATNVFDLNSTQVEYPTLYTSYKSSEENDLVAVFHTNLVWIFNNTGERTFLHTGFNSYDYGSVEVQFLKYNYINIELYDDNENLIDINNQDSTFTFQLDIVKEIIIKKMKYLVCGGSGIFLWCRYSCFILLKRR